MTCDTCYTEDCKPEARFYYKLSISTDGNHKTIWTLYRGWYNSRPNPEIITLRDMICLTGFGTSKQDCIRQAQKEIDRQKKSEIVTTEVILL